MGSGGNCGRLGAVFRIRLLILFIKEGVEGRIPFFGALLEVD